MRPLLLALALSGLALGCGGATPALDHAHTANGSPALPSRPAASALATSAARAPAPEPGACAPRRVRASKSQSRSGSSIALVDDGSRRLLYVADEDNRALHTLDAEGPSELSVTPLPGQPAQLLPLADGRVLVTLRDKNRLLVLEPGERAEAPLAIRCEVPTSAEPFGLAVSVDGERVALTTGWDHQLVLLRAAGLDVERVVDLPPEPRGVLLSGDGATAYVAHLVGGVISSVNLAHPEEPPRRIIARPPRPEPAKTPAKTKGARAKEINSTQSPAASQGFALAEISLGADEHGKPWPARVFVPMASADPMRFGPEQSFPGVYGGSGGPAVIGAFVAVVDPISKTPLGGEVAPLRQARPEDCIVPRAVAAFGHHLLMTCLGTNTLIDLDARAVDPTSAEQRRVDVGPGPTGLVVDPVKQRALVLSAWSGEIRVVDLANPENDTSLVLRLARPEKPALSPAIARGRELFYVTRDVRLSFDGRACASCHPDGRADGLTWATPDGPRQTILLAGRLEGSAPYGWFGDHVGIKNHVLFTVSRLGGLGFHEPKDEEDLNALLAYVRSLGLPSREGAIVAEGIEAQRARGRELFYAEETGCSTCHVGDASDGKRHDVGSGDAREKRLSFDTPGLRGIKGSAPYFHDGRYATLMDLLSDPKSKMGRSAQLSVEDRRALVAYLESL